MTNIPMPVIAGALSTILFTSSMLPMLRKALVSKDLRSYSPAMLVMTNTGNLVHSVYVYSLPPGPIWVLHTFHLLSTALMLAWYLRYEWRPSPLRRDPRPAGPSHLHATDPAPCA